MKPDAAAYQAIKQAAAEQGASSYRRCRATFKVLMARLLGQDVVVTIPTAGVPPPAMRWWATVTLCWRRLGG
ncbi:MAG: hypothetical protein R3A44_02495 [Caldilineaceae bacterium]